jgi:hypothetical protein
MEGALIVVPLVGLTLPISMLIAAILIDGVIAFWAAYRIAHDRHGHKPA